MDDLMGMGIGTGPNKNQLEIMRKLLANVPSPPIRLAPVNSVGEGILQGAQNLINVLQARQANNHRLAVLQALLYKEEQSAELARAAKARALQSQGLDPVLANLSDPVLNNLANNQFKILEENRKQVAEEKRINEIANTLVRMYTRPVIGSDGKPILDETGKPKMIPMLPPAKARLFAMSMPSGAVAEDLLKGDANLLNDLRRIQLASNFNPNTTSGNNALRFMGITPVTRDQMASDYLANQGTTLENQHKANELQYQIPQETAKLANTLAETTGKVIGNKTNQIKLNNLPYFQQQEYNLGQLSSAQKQADLAKYQYNLALTRQFFESGANTDPSKVPIFSGMFAGIAGDSPISAYLNALKSVQGQKGDGMLNYFQGRKPLDIDFPAIPKIDLSPPNPLQANLSNANQPNLLTNLLGQAALTPAAQQSRAEMEEAERQEGYMRTIRTLYPYMNLIPQFGE